VIPHRREREDTCQLDQERRHEVRGVRARVRGRRAAMNHLPPAAAPFRALPRLRPTTQRGRRLQPGSQLRGYFCPTPRKGKRLLNGCASCSASSVIAAVREASAPASYPHDDFGNGMCMTKGRTPAPRETWSALVRLCARSRLFAHRRRRGAGLATGDKVGHQSPLCALLPFRCVGQK